MNDAKFSIRRVELTPIPPESSGELAKNIVVKCRFCEKNCEIGMDPAFWSYLAKDFHCPFCIRHGFHLNRKDILILSFRSVFAYYYATQYLRKRKLWLCEIKDLIAAHAEVGLSNPLFFYDPETMLWFVDFARVGREKHKLPFHFVQQTISSVIHALELDRFPGLNAADYTAKFHDAVKAFHRRRYRPKNRRVLIPTFKGCGVDEAWLTRNFVFANLVSKK